MVFTIYSIINLDYLIVLVSMSITMQGNVITINIDLKSFSQEMYDLLQAF